MAAGPDDIHRLIDAFQSVRDGFVDDKEAVIAIYSFVSPKHDARITAYSKAINVLNSLQLAFTFISKHLLHGQWWEAVARSPIPDSDKQIYANEFANFTKVAFVQELFLSIESSLRLFLRAIDPAACNGGMAEFKSIYECLFRSRLSAVPSNGIALLDLLRLVRNTMGRLSLELGIQDHSLTLGTFSFTSLTGVGKHATITEGVFQPHFHKRSTANSGSPRVRIIPSTDQDSLFQRAA